MDKTKDNKHYGVDEVFNLLGEENLMGETRGTVKGDMEIDGYMVHPRSLRKVSYAASVDAKVRILNLISSQEIMMEIGGILTFILKMVY